MNLLPQIDAAKLISPLDLVVFFGILLLTFFVVFWGHSKRGRIKKENNVLEYLLMGRTLTLPLFTATLVASWYGGIFGVTEIAFNSGIYNFFTQGVFWYATYLIFAFFLVKRVRSFEAVTLPELVGKLFGPRSQKVAAVFNFFNVLPVAYVISVGLFLQIIFGGELLYWTAFGSLVITLYSMWGGFRSVVFSDLVQFFVMCSSVFLVVAFSWSVFGGVSYLRSHLPASHFDPMGGHSLATTLVWGFIALATLVDPNFYQRCFAADRPETARNGILISTIIWCGFDLCTTLGGMYARAAVPEAQSNHSYLVYALQILPDGLRGFFLAGVLATILSTLDSFMFVASNTLSYDLAPRGWKGKTRFGHLCSVGTCVFAIFLSTHFSGSIKDVWKTLGSYSAGCLLLPMVIGFWKPRFLSDRGFVVSTALGACGVTFWRMTEHSGLWAEVDALYVGMVFTSLGIVTSKTLKI